MPNICSRKLNIQKTKWNGAEEPTINNFFTIDSSVLWDLYGPPEETPSGKKYIRTKLQISKHHLDCV